MTIAELIEILTQYPPETPVHIATSEGWHEPELEAWMIKVRPHTDFEHYKGEYTGQIDAIALNGE